MEQPSQTANDQPVAETGSIESDDEKIPSDAEPEEQINDHFNQIDEEKQVIESKIDPKEWQLECERVTQKLKI